jgi:ribosomal-protein-alanine N-acetyltransferase
MALPLAVLHGACFPEDPWDAPAFERILGLFGVFGYLAVDPAEPAGFILARDLGGEAEILTLGVLPALRRHGAARALLDRVLDEARRRGLGSVVLEVAADNDAARRLYAAAGFLRVGQRPRYYCRRGGTVDGLILRRGITSEAASP